MKVTSEKYKDDIIELNNYKELFTRWYENLWTEKIFWKGAVKKDRLEAWMKKFDSRQLSLDKKAKTKHLEIGCGPIPPILDDFTSTEKSDFIFSDPLVPYYSEIWKQLGYEIPSNFRFSICEFADSFFGEEVFDTIAMQNALDHTINPIMCMIAMVSALKMGGEIRLIHRVNEAVFENYSGLHKWNISAEKDDVIISSKDKLYSIKEILGDCCTIESEFKGTEKEPQNYLVINTIKKTGKIVKSQEYIQRCNVFMSHIISKFADKALTSQPSPETKLNNVITPLYLFGAGEVGETAYEFLKEHGKTPRGFLDNDSSKHGMKKCGLPIFTPDEVEKNAAIIISASDEENILKSIKGRYANITKFSELLF